MPIKNQKLKMSENAKRVEEIRRIDAGYNYVNPGTLQEDRRFLLSELDRERTRADEIKKLVKQAFLEGYHSDSSGAAMFEQETWESSSSRRELGEI